MQIKCMGKSGNVAKHNKHNKDNYAAFATSHKTIYEQHGSMF